MNQLIKRCVMLTLIWTSTIFITWCTLFNKKENVEEQKNQEITMKNDNKIQSFDSLVLTTNEKFSNWVSEFFQKSDKYLNEKKIKSEAKWNITISYWNVVWTINFDSMWKIDKELNKLFWKLAFWFEWKNLKEIDENQKDIKVDIWIEWILWWKTSFVKITNWELWWIDMFLFPENWSKLLKKIKDKWIRFHWKTICDKWHKDYSEQWCMISKKLNNFKEEFIKVASNTWEVRSNHFEMQENIKKIIEKWIKESITTEMLTKWNETEIDWKKAYQFDINKELFKEKIISIVSEIYDEVSKTQDNNYFLTTMRYWEIDESENQENKEEMKKEFLKWFEKLEIRDFEWYLIDSWDWEIDIDIKNITFWVKQDEKKKENCDKEKWTCDLKDFTVIDEDEILSKKEFKLSFSTIKKELKLTSLENWKENVEIKFNWEKTNEWYKFTINISPTIEWKKLQDVISIVSVNWLNSTENWEEWKSHNMITIKKELWQSWWFFEFDKNIVIKFDYEIKTDFNWFEDITNPEKSISYTKLENDIKKLENKNDLVQEKIDWNLEIKDKNIKK